MASKECDRFILCYHNSWHESIIKSIDENTMADHNLVWRCDNGDCLKDHRSAYSAGSAVLAAMIRSAAARKSDTELCIEIATTGFLEDPVLLRFMRVYCHTGITLLEENETFNQLYSKHCMCQCYELSVAQSTVSGALSVKMDCAGALRILSDTSGTTLQDGDVAKSAGNYFKRHPQECLRKLSSSAVMKMSDAFFGMVIKLLGETDVNAAEADIMDELYLLCTRRCRNDGNAAQHLFLGQENEHCVPLHSVNASKLTFQQVMDFKQKHVGAFESGFYMDLLDSIHQDKTDNQKRSHCAVSSYPTNLKFPVLRTNSYICSTLQSSNYTISYVAVPVMRSGHVDIPSFIVAGHSILTMQITFQGQHVNATGCMNLGVTTLTSDQKWVATSLEIRVVNFCRDRLKKTETAIVIKQNEAFNIPKIILIATLENGYTFNPQLYPVIVDGTHMLLKVTCKSNPRQVTNTKD